MEPAKVTFATIDLTNLNKYVQTGTEFTSTMLYMSPQEGVCDTCKQLLGQCRGHISIEPLRYPHLNPLYREEIQSIRNALCFQCRLPKAEVQKECSVSRWSIHRGIREYYNTKLDGKNFICTCSQSASVSKAKNRELVKNFENLIRKSPDLFKALGISDPSRLIQRYYVVIPSVVISVMIDAKTVSSAYISMKPQGSRKVDPDRDFEEEDEALNTLYDALYKSITGKMGLCRQHMITVSRGLSARAVMISDPALGIDEVGLSPKAAKTLLTEVEFTGDNLDYCTELITRGRVHDIELSNDRYKIYESRVNVCCTVLTKEEGANTVVLGLDSEIVGGDPELLDNAKTPQALVDLLNTEKGMSVVCESGTHKVLRGSAILSVTGVRISQTAEVLEVPLQVGAKLHCVANETLLMGHRNPVMSANSMRFFRGVLNGENTSHILTSVEKHQQKVKAKQTSMMFFAEGKTPPPVGSNIAVLGYRELESLASVLDNNYCVTVVSAVPEPPEEPYEDNNATVALNSIATEGFNGDFDGDEFNLVVTNVDGQKSTECSLLVDMCRETDGKPVYFPKHDAQYGVYVLTHKLGSEVERLAKCLEGFQESKYVAKVQQILSTLPKAVPTSENHKGLLEKDLSVTKRFCALVEYARSLYISQKILGTDGNSGKITGVAQSSKEITGAGGNSEKVTGADGNSEKITGADGNSEKITGVTQSSEEITGADGNSEKIAGANVSSTSPYPSAESLSFLLHVLTLPDPKIIMKPIEFNRMVCRYFMTMKTLGMLGVIDTTRGLSRFYSEVLRCMYHIADSYGMLFDYEGKFAKIMIDSKARSSAATYDSIYKSVGNTQYNLPGNIKCIDGIDGSYKAGLSLPELISLSYTNRKSLSKKAREVAPAGHLMRLVCNYMTYFKRESNVWSYRGSTFYREIVSSPESTLVMLRHVETVQPLSLILKLEERFRYRDYRDIPTSVRDVLGVQHHRGQLKLLLSEIEFLTSHYRPDATMVYAGAAPGTHLPLLIKLFPGLKIHAYDTSKFCEAMKKLHKEQKSVIIFKKYLTVEKAAEYAKLTDILYCSDIRTNEKGSGPSDEDVAANNKLNVDIVMAMNPVACLLKFRCPFNTPEDVSNSIKGEYLLQAWSKSLSAESRLVATQPYEVCQVSHKVYESAMFTHNLRRSSKYSGFAEILSLKTNLKIAGIPRGFDYAYYCLVVSNYCKKFNKDPEDLYKLIEHHPGCSVLPV